MSDALGLFGFYFTLIGFISGLFFTRIDSWYGSVRAFYGELNSYTDRTDFIKAKTNKSSLIASKPQGSFIAVGLLMSSLTVLSFFVPIQSSTVNPIIFILGPLVLTVAAYWIGGAALIGRAGRILSAAEEKIAKGISGQK